MSIASCAEQEEANQSIEREQANELSQQDAEVFIQGSDTDFLIKLLGISIGGMPLAFLCEAGKPGVII